MTELQKQVGLEEKVASDMFLHNFQYILRLARLTILAQVLITQP